MQSTSQAPRTRLPRELAGTRKGLFHLLRIAGSTRRAEAEAAALPRPAPRPAAPPSAAVHSTLARAAMADMFCFKGN